MKNNLRAYDSGDAGSQYRELGSRLVDNQVRPQWRLRQRSKFSICQAQ